MSASLSPTQNDAFVKLQAFVMGLTGLQMEQVIQGLGNGVSMPLGGFVAMTELFKSRLSTNVQAYADTSPTTGEKRTSQAMQVTFQIDCYGPNSADWASMISTMLRDDYGCQALAPVMQPLRAEDPKMVPLIDGEQQYEQRWMVSALVQINPTVTTPMEFFDEALVGVVEVDTHFPP